MAKAMRWGNRDSLTVGTRLPRLYSQSHIAALRDKIVRDNLKVVFIDPLYLCLLDASTAGQASNAYAMGANLEPLTALEQETGVTLILLHHFRKNEGDRRRGDQEPATLEMFSQSGIDAWVRQWVLIERRTPYVGDGQHSLRLSIGGSFGHAGLYTLDVDEGVLDAKTHGGRKWDVRVKTMQEERATVQQTREEQRAAALEEKQEDHRNRVLEALQNNPAGLTERELTRRSGVKADNGHLDRALRSLKENGQVEEHPVAKDNGQSYPGFRIVNPEKQATDTTDTD